MLPSISARWTLGCLVVPVSLFVGVMIATAGTAVWPQITGLATPLICPGQVEHRSDYWSVRPGEQGISRTIYCVTGDGARADITVKAIGVSFLVYSAIAFAVFGLLGMWVHRRVARGFDSLGLSRQVGSDARAAGAAQRASADVGKILGLVADAVERGGPRVVVRTATIGETADSERDPAERLALLKQLYDEGLIDADDYEAKKAEIVSGL